MAILKSAYRWVWGLSLVLTVPGVAAAPQATGPLRVHPTNGRYVTDGSGRAIYLTGSHSWNTFQVWSNLSTVTNQTQYFDLLQANNQNFMRFWVADTAWSPDTMTAIEPQPYVRTGPGNAADGRPKFDLNQLNQAYFDQLRSVVVAARDRGIYVSVMLFNSWGLARYQTGGGNTPWLYHPFRSTNNVNGIDGDPNGDGVGFETHSNQIPAIVSLQQAYVRKVVDTVNDLDNVLYEISNEDDTAAAKDWQYDLITLIKNYEASLPKQHLVGMTQISNNSPAINDWLTASPADWISPGAQAWDSVTDPYNVDPPAADGGKVSLLDTDHLYYYNFKDNPGLTRAWVWKTFTRGHNPLLMEDLSNASGWVAARAAMGQTRTYANRMDLASMTPQNGLSSTGYCLANPGVELITYQPDSAAFSVFLNAGTYSVEWFDTVNGTTSASSEVAVPAGWSSFTPPFAEAALYLKAVAVGGGPPAIPVITSPANNATVTTTSVTVSWAAASGAASYLVRCEDLTGVTPTDPRNTWPDPFLGIDLWPSTDITFSVVDGHSYHFWVHSAAANFSYNDPNSYSAPAEIWFSVSVGGGVVPVDLSGTYTLLNVNSGLALDIDGGSLTDGAAAVQWTPSGAASQQWQVTPASGGAYFLTNVNSGKALDVYGEFLDPGTPVIQWTFSGRANEQWQLLPVGDGSYYLLSVNSGQALNVSGALTTAGAPVIQWPYGGEANARWLLQATSTTSGGTTPGIQSGSASPMKPSGGSGGKCGLLGLEILLPLGMLGSVRRRIFLKESSRGSKKDA